MLLMQMRQECAGCLKTTFSNSTGIKRYFDYNVDDASVVVISISGAVLRVTAIGQRRTQHHVSRGRQLTVQKD